VFISVYHAFILSGSILLKKLSMNFLIFLEGNVEPSVRICR